MADQPKTLVTAQQNPAEVPSLDIDAIQCQALFAQQAREKRESAGGAVRTVSKTPWGHGLRWG